jgi:hypothetical protein
MAELYNINLVIQSSRVKPEPTQAEPFKGPGLARID